MAIPSRYILDLRKRKKQNTELNEFKTGSYGNARSKEEIVDINLIPF